MPVFLHSAHRHSNYIVYTLNLPNPYNGIAQNEEDKHEEEVEGTKTNQQTNAKNEWVHTEIKWNETVTEKCEKYSSNSFDESKQMVCLVCLTSDSIEDDDDDDSANSNWPAEARCLDGTAVPFDGPQRQCSARMLTLTHLPTHTEFNKLEWFIVFGDFARQTRNM